MQQTLLALDRAPPFTAPVRCFLAAPPLAMLAGLLLIVDPALFASRWMPGALAFTHLLTVGFLWQVMQGALIQVLPVVAGLHVERPAALARRLQALVAAGALLLALGFLVDAAWAGRCHGAAGLLLGLAVIDLLRTVGPALWRIDETSPTIGGLKRALPALGITVALGLALLLGRHGHLPAALPAAWADVHAAWGIAGWVGGLLAALSWVVVPMFQLTPGYPTRFAARWPRLMWLCLGLATLGALAGGTGGLRLGLGGAALCGLAWVGLTLRLQAQRRRARADALSRFWRLGLAASGAALGLIVTGCLWPPLTQMPSWPFFIGLLLGVGGVMSFVIGMLYKIVPFLAWLHLSQIDPATAPGMHEFIAEADMRRHLGWHAASLGLLLAAPVAPEAGVRLAGVVFLIANTLLAKALFGAVRRYRAAARTAS